MTKKKVLIASILKPVDEPRMYKKLGLSIAELPGFEVHIAGYKAESEPKNSPLKLHPLFDFSRLSIKRLLSGNVFYKFLKEQKPDILIINTYELLTPSVRYKKHSKCVLICDIRENQSLNITQQNNYGSLLRNIFANHVRTTEEKYFPFVDHFILAERCYAREMIFREGKFSILENKYVGEKLQHKNYKDQKIRFCFTGTAHESTGVFRAIDFVKGLLEKGIHAELYITAHAALKEVYTTLNSFDYKWLKLDVSRSPVSQNKILYTYQLCDVMLAPYVLGPHIKDKLPTKLYDALANGIPMIISQNEFWKYFTIDYPYIFHFDFENESTDIVIEWLDQLKSQNPIMKSAYWEEEKEILKSLIMDLDLS